jgi:hypothetical protein
MFDSTGFDANAPTLLFNGFLDDIVFYDRPLNDIEVKALFEDGSIRSQCRKSFIYCLFVFVLLSKFCFCRTLMMNNTAGKMIDFLQL